MFNTETTLAPISKPPQNNFLLKIPFILPLARSPFVPALRRTWRHLNLKILEECTVYMNSFRRRYAWRVAEGRMRRAELKTAGKHTGAVTHRRTFSGGGQGWKSSSWRRHGSRGVCRRGAPGRRVRGGAGDPEGERRRGNVSILRFLEVSSCLIV